MGVEHRVDAVGFTASRKTKAWGKEASEPNTDMSYLFQGTLFWRVYVCVSGWGTVKPYVLSV